MSDFDDALVAVWGSQDEDAESFCRGIPYPVTRIHNIARHKRQINRRTIVYGNVEPVLFALDVLRVPRPKPQPYPDCLSPYMGRTVQIMPLAKVYPYLQSLSEPCFVKPADAFKLFTGFIIFGQSEWGKLCCLPPHAQIYACSVVHFVSEWRVYVIRGKILGQYWYWGSNHDPVDMKVVEEAVQIYQSQPDSMDAYCIDFGLTETGETLLVELNEGFSIGNYGLPDEDYAQLIETRWRQLIKQE